MIYYYLLARQYVYFFLFLLDVTVVQLNTVALWGTIADRRDQENVQPNGIGFHTHTHTHTK